MNDFLACVDDGCYSHAFRSREMSDIFQSKEGSPQLEVSRLYATPSLSEKREVGSMPYKTEFELSSARNISDLRDADDPLQIFTIRQERSWTTLNISEDLFNSFMAEFRVFRPFWKCVATFGDKHEEHECEFPGFSSQRTSHVCAMDAFECAYVLRRAELHGRKLSEGQCPYSIRQTAVYHKVSRQMASCRDSRRFPLSVPDSDSSEARSRFLLISPSKTVQEKFERLLDLATYGRHKEAIQHSVIHSVLVADSMKGWMNYIAWLEQDLKQRSDRVTFSKLGSKDKDFTFSVEDRQALKLAEDSVIDLQTITSTLLNIVKGLRTYCQQSCEAYCERRSEEKVHICDRVLEEFHTHVSDVELITSRAQLVRDRVVSSAQELSDLLRYEDQRALKELTEQSATENRTMLNLAEKATKDAEATKVLTIIGLVYLPTTFVANFFSTEFVKADDSGVIRVAANTWLLAVLALPLTLLTVGIWWLCVRHKTGMDSLLGPLMERLGSYCRKFPKARRSHGAENLALPHTEVRHINSRTLSEASTLKRPE